MIIQEIFRSPIDRRIEEVIKVDLADEETVALELDEYEVTNHIRGTFEQLLDHYQETIKKPNEVTNAWVSNSSAVANRPTPRCWGICWRTPRSSANRRRHGSSSARATTGCGPC
jgi:hypothetical protein